MTNEKKLSVRLCGVEVGILEEKNGKMRFKYRDDARFQLSMSMPIRKEVYSEAECRGYFGGLLPENDKMRYALAKKYKISQNSDFALLRAIGKDCAGAVSFHEIDEKEKVGIYDKIECYVYTSAKLVDMIKNLPTRPYMGKKMSLAGVQEKTAVCVSADKIGEPVDDAPTTHILKPQTIFKQSVQNEYICMKTASNMGIFTAAVEMRTVKDVDFLLIERFDRAKEKLDGKYAVCRLPQEDFAQASGVWAADKYDFTFKDCAKILEKLTEPAYDKQNFINYAIFNYLIGNCDAHSKNFSVCVLTKGAYLTPLYDVLCTCIYENLDDNMAMKIGNARKISKVTRADWEIFADDMDVASKFVFKELKRQATALPETLKGVVNEVSAPIGFEILDFVNKNCARVLKYLQ